MSRRKNLNDVIYGDRATIRGSSYQRELDDWPKSSGSKSYKGGDSYSDYGQRCYHSHPPMQLPSTELIIHGGSCSSPAVKDADIYVGLCSSMRFTERNWPWKKGYEVLFAIPDMGVPAKPDEFKKLVAWVRRQLEEGKKVHVGCIGGHGRTGTFLSALVSTFGEADAITYVRKHYCKKAVESTEQVKFLGEHFGVLPAQGYKAGGHHSHGSNLPVVSKHTASVTPIQPKTFNPMRSESNVWGPDAP